MKIAEGILLIDKPKGKTSFWLVAVLRRILKVKKIGHAGTLDPLATGVMVLLVGSTFTRKSDQFLSDDKEYEARIHFGVATDSYDADGVETSKSDLIPSKPEVIEALKKFQGEIEQIPPMFSAKKVQGKKLYELARQGKEIERKPCKVKVDIEFLEYEYPILRLRVKCSKGTYIRSLAHDLGQVLGCGAFLEELIRTRSGKFLLNECLDGSILSLPPEVALPHVLHALKI